MASKLLSLALRLTVPKSSLGSSQIHYLSKIGKREVVGYGWNGEPIYFDRVDYPMPAIRFREENDEIKALREKEKGDWTKLSIDDKKALYRASFCKTFSEIKAPTGLWKVYLGMGLLSIGIAMFYHCLVSMFLYTELPVTFEIDRRKAQLKRMIDLEVNPISGLSSEWDYENKKWK